MKKSLLYLFVFFFVQYFSSLAVFFVWAQVKGVSIDTLREIGRAHV